MDGTASADEQSKASVTLLKLKTLWHLSQPLLQQGFGVENNEKDSNECPQKCLVMDNPPVAINRKKITMKLLTFFMFLP
jgi:hypothetical protein